MKPYFETAELNKDDGKWHDGAEGHLGRCPKCGSENIEYGPHKVESPFLIFPGTCLDCGQTFEELHDTPFSHIEWEDD